MKAWERSFPSKQLQGHSWMVSVLEDLASYCDYNDLPEIELEIREVLERITSKYAHVVLKGSIDKEIFQPGCTSDL